MKTKSNAKILLLALLIAAAALFALPFGTGSAFAANSAYSFEIENLTVNYDVHADRTIDVEERVTIKYTGYSSTGFYRDLPVNEGDRVYNVEVKEANASGAQFDVDYGVDIDDGLIILDIGDNTKKTGESHTYIIKYVYAVTAPKDDNALYLNIVGFGSEAPIRDSLVTVHLPDGFKSADLYIGDTAIPSDAYDYDSATNTITVELAGLAAFEGATLDMFFEEGVLSTRIDFVPYIMVIAGCVLLAALAAVKFFVFPKKPLSPVVGFEPPRGMDPVEISKLIDNSVDSHDVTSIIYYWASKGYLKIDLSDQNDPVLIRVYNRLPDGAPEHQIVMYNALFGNRDMVSVSQLEGKFYRTIENVKALVNRKYSRLYTAKSTGTAFAFALAGGLIMALAPIITGMVNISAKLIYLPALIAVVPALGVFFLARAGLFAVHKRRSGTRIAVTAGIVALCAAATALYAILLPSPIMELAPKIVVCIVAYIAVLASVTLISPTEEYYDLLNEIIGFRNFILYTEKDKLEVMLESDPEFYYKLLPYAQVMGISDIWEDKFKDLTVAPPSWAVDPAGTLVSFTIVNSALRRSYSSFAGRMAVRPSSPSSRSFSGGSRFGGGFGGRGGGGHGGGGFRGR